MKVYVINMERSKSRLVAIKRQLNRLKLNYEVIHAVDGRTMTEEEMDETVSLRSEFTKSQAGCMLSHCKVYKAILQNKDPYALVLEDDVLITDNKFRDMLAALPPMLDDNNITLLTYYWCRENSLLLTKKDPLKKIAGAEGDYFICAPHDVHGIGRAAAYVLSANTAKKILDFHKPKLVCQADSWIVYQKNGIINSVSCLYPMPVTENPQFGSEIGYTRNKVEALAKKLVEKALDMRLPVISSLVMKKRMNFAQNYKNIKLEDQK